MKSEKKIQIEVYLRFLFVFVFAALYAWGGLENKWLRRFVAPGVLCGGMAIFARDWKCLIQAPLMMITLSMGYGAEDNGWKIVRRGIYGLANGFSSSTYSIYSATKNAHLWAIPIFQVPFVMTVNLIFGTMNLINARAEEFLIGVVISMIPMLAIKRKETI